MLCRPKPVVAALGTTAILLLASLAQAQMVTRPIVSNHDFDSATMTYAVLSPSKEVIGLNKIKTTGSSATVDAASGTPFADVAAGDEITVLPIGGANSAVVFYVLTRASSTQITADRAIDLSGNGATGYSFSFRTLTKGTADDVGWFEVSDGWTSRQITFQVEQLSLLSGSLAVQIDCKGASPWAKPTKVYPPVGLTGQCGTGLFTVAGATARCAYVLALEERWSACRFGVSLTDDANDLTTNLEKVTAWFEGKR